MIQPPFETEISELVWQRQYRYRPDTGGAEDSVEKSWDRVAHAVANIESNDANAWEARFRALLQDFCFLPGGRILAGAGTGYDVTLFNCFVMGTIDDSMEGIFDALKEGAITMQLGGGVGYDFSSLRPAGTQAWRVGGVASGPVSFMRIWDSMCETLLSTAARRGAMMATLRCDHPDIETFIEAKQTAGELKNFNLSVLVSDAFIQAVDAGSDWDLVFPIDGLGGEPQSANRRLVMRRWPGYEDEVACEVMRTLNARELWDRIIRSSYDTAEPGVLFIDRINRENNLAYRETIFATNPCGEIPLPPYGACNLGSLNLTRFVHQPFTERARPDLTALQRVTSTAVRFLDNVIDLSRYPLAQQAAQARGSRRIGLGITGLADALIMLGLDYGDEPSRALAAEIMRTIRDAAYRCSVQLSQEKGPHPFLDRDACLQQPFIQRLPDDIRGGIAQHGLRNSHLTAIAPTGTISLLANNVSGGIEPVFDFEHRRRMRGPDGAFREYQLQDVALQQWRKAYGERPLPGTFVSALDLDPMDHLAMQAALQPFVDNAISKTINVPEDYDFTRFSSIYTEAYRRGLKGCTTFRPNPVTGAILQQTRGDTTQAPLASHCCDAQRTDD